MLPGKISKRVVTGRLAWIDRMLREIRSLPLHSPSAFTENSKNMWAAKSCLRWSREALFDFGRHTAAKGFGEAVMEDKEIATAFHRHGILSTEERKLMQKLAGYRNRLLHFYHDVRTEELYEIFAFHLGDIETITDDLRKWIKNHPGNLDETL